MKIIVFILFLLLNVNLSLGANYYPSGSIETGIQEKTKDFKADNWDSNIQNLNYLRDLIHYFQRKGGDPISQQKLLKRSSEGSLMLGYLFDTNGNQWFLNKNKRYGSYDDYKKTINELRDLIQNVKVSYSNGLFLGWDEYAKKYAIKLHMGVLAGISSGYLPRPDASLQHQYLSTEESLRYSFRIGQQALRTTIIENYIDELIEMRKESLGFLYFVKDLCKESSNIYSTLDFSPAGGSPDRISGKCWGTFYYQPITNNLMKLAQIIFELNQRELTLLCTQSAMLAWQLNQLTTITELLLYQTNALYNLLQNQE